VAELRRLGGTPPEVLAHPELMQLVLPLLRADFAVVETYAHREAPPLDCPVTAFGGVDDEDASEAPMDAWRAQTRGAFALHMLPGGHFYLKPGRVRAAHVPRRPLLPQGRHRRRPRPGVARSAAAPAALTITRPGRRSAQAPSAQKEIEDEALLLLGAFQPYRLRPADMILRHLTYRSVCRGDDAEHLGHGPAIFLAWRTKTRPGPEQGVPRPIPGLGHAITPRRPGSAPRRPATSSCDRNGRSALVEARAARGSAAAVVEVLPCPCARQHLGRSQRIAGEAEAHGAGNHEPSWLSNPGKTHNPIAVEKDLVSV
jgi:hypothetical protein